MPLVRFQDRDVLVRRRLWRCLKSGLRCAGPGLWSDDVDALGFVRRKLGVGCDCGFNEPGAACGGVEPAGDEHSDQQCGKPADEIARTRRRLQ